MNRHFRIWSEEIIGRNMAQFWINLNFGIYLAVFGFALIRNCNFNIILVGCIYLAPLIPLGLTPENADRFLLISFFNTIFGIIELIIFTVTVKKEDMTFWYSSSKAIFLLGKFSFAITLGVFRFRDE